MPSVLFAVAKEATAAPLESALANASDLLTSIVDEKAYVGEVYSPGYEDALVQIHDYHRREVGGIPALSSSVRIMTRCTDSIRVRRIFEC
jgi:hypothetical protein